MVVGKWLAVVAGTALTFTGSVSATAEDKVPAECGGTHWVGSWMAAPSDSLSVGDPSLIPQLSASDQTYRLVITPHRGGSVLRIHLTNRTRPVPMTLDHVTIAAQADGPAVRPDSVREVRFGGNRAVTIEAWSDVVSDPVELPHTAWQPLSVSVYAPGLAVLPTQHFNANATSYYGPPFTGNHTANAAGTQLLLSTASVPFVSGLDVQAPGDVSAVVAFGDSITDGYVSSNILGIPQEIGVIDRDVRYPDFLQRRLDAAGARLVVLNAGISGNRVTRDGLIPQFGAAAVTRVEQDVIDKAGVTDAIILEGINDIGMPISAGYEQVVAGYIDLINRLHTAGVQAHLATILPGSNSLTERVLPLPDTHAIRQRINAWIRDQQLSDSVIDLDAALRDPANPDRLAPRYAGPDNLHPNADGYRAIGAAIDLNIFHRGCR